MLLHARGSGLWNGTLLADLSSSLTNADVREDSLAWHFNSHTCKRGLKFAIEALEDAAELDSHLVLRSRLYFGAAASSHNAAGAGEFLPYVKHSGSSVTNSMHGS